MAHKLGMCPSQKRRKNIL